MSEPINEHGLAKIWLRQHGPIATHNMPCTTCSGRPAVYFTGSGQFDPCWTCQAEGWRTIRLPRWLRWWRP